MTTAHDRMRDHIETSRYMQDRHERGQARVADQLWETDQALSNRVRFFAAGVLAVSWGLLLDPRASFDLRFLLTACVLAMVSLMLDFAYLSFRRSALEAALRRGDNVLDGIGPFRGLAQISGLLRALFFFAATGALAAAALMALLPQLAPSAG
jgi:hypothetical protein